MSLLLHCDVIKTPSVQTWFVYFFVSVQPLSTNFGQKVADITNCWSRDLVLHMQEFFSLEISV